MGCPFPNVSFILFCSSSGIANLFTFFKQIASTSGTFTGASAVRVKFIGVSLSSRSADLRSAWIVVWYVSGACTCSATVFWTVSFFSSFFCSVWSFSSTTADWTTRSHPDTARRFIHRTAPINIFIFFILFPSFPVGIKKGTLFLWEKSTILLRRCIHQDVNKL